MHNFTLSLTINKKSCQPGSYIDGTISLYVPPSAANCEDYSGIHLIFKGEESVHMGKWHLDAVPFVVLDTEVVTVSPRLISGQYEYPFLWKIPESLPCSMVCLSEESTALSSCCEVCYTFAAYLKRKSQNGFDMDCCKNELANPVLIKIDAPSSPMLCSGAHSENNAIKPKEGKIIFDRKKIAIRSRLRSKGTLDIGIDIADQEGVSAEPYLSIGITGENQSSVPVDHLLIQLSETVEWNNAIFGLNFQQQKRVLAERVVMVHHVPSFQARSLKQNRRSTTDIDRISVQLQCKNARDSFSGDLLRASHSLKVVAVVKGRHTTNPKFETILSLHRHANKKTAPPMATVVEIEQQPQPLWKDQNVGGAFRPTNALIHSNSNWIEIPHAVPVSMDTLVTIPDKTCNNHQNNVNGRKVRRQNSEIFLFARTDCGIDFSDLEYHPGAEQRHISAPALVMIVD